MKRRCAYGEQHLDPHGGMTLLGIPLVFRYSCVECNHKFEIFSPLGTWVATGLSGFLGIGVCAGGSRWASESEAILGSAFVLALSTGMLALVWRSRQEAERNPPVE